MEIARARWTVLALLDAAVLVTARPDTELLHDLAAPRDWLARVGADLAVARLAGAGLWLAAGWIGLALLAVAAAGLPGGAGRAAARFARVALPRAVLRLVAGAAGLGVLIAPVAARAATAPTTPSAPAWPTSTAPAAPAWPTAPPPDERSPAGAHAAPPDRPAHASAGPRARPAERRSVRVRAGDSLWTIAADHLPGGRRTPAQIAAAWPRWYAANRHVIGTDPNHIETGQQLRPPAQHPPTAPRTETGR